MSATPTPPPPGTITMYSTSWCGYCGRLRGALDRAGIGYTEVDIEGSRGAANFVRNVNHGNQTVPTVVFPDGTAATNPSLAQVRVRLAESATSLQQRADLRGTGVVGPAEAVDVLDA